jgi:hypothetical protein
MNFIIYAGFVLKLIAAIVESANGPLPCLKAWKSARNPFIMKVSNEVGEPNCLERAKHFPARRCQYSSWSVREGGTGTVSEANMRLKEPSHDDRFARSLLH